MSKTTLCDILAEEPVSLVSSEPVAKALEMMKEHKISSIVIVDATKRPVGILTEYDALRIVSGSIALTAPILEVMRREPFCVEDSLYIHDAYGKMEENQIRHLIVIDAHGALSGVVSEGDFLRHMGLDHLTRFKSVREAMKDSLLVVSPDTTLVETAVLMNQRTCDYAVVMDGRKPGGIITERDIARWCIREGVDAETRVLQVMRGDFRIINNDLPLQEAAAIMQQHNVHQLIVTDGSGSLEGLLTRHDVLHTLHGAYFEFLIRLIDQKSAIIEQMGEFEKQLIVEKEWLQKNELKLRKLFESFPDGIMLIDGTTMCPVEFNAAANGNLGYTPEEFSKLRIFEYEAIETVEQVQTRIQKIIREGRDSFETVHRKKNGGLMNVWVNVVLIQIAGHPHMIAHMRDITEIKRSEEVFQRQQIELSRKSSFLHTLINAIPDLIWLKDIDGAFLTCNHMVERLYNAKEADIIGKNDFDFVSPEVARLFRENDMAAVAMGSARSNEEYLKFGDGSYEGYFETIKTPMKDAQGKLMGVLGIARDISERKRKDDEIKRVQELAHIGTWEWDIENDAISGSDETYRLYGIDPRKAISITDILNRVHPDDRECFEREITDALEKGTYNSLYRIIRNGNDVRWLQSNAKFQNNENGERIKGIGIVLDMTDRIRHEEELRQKDNDLNAAQALAHIGSWRLDIGRDLLEWSDETYRIFGINVGMPLTYESFLSAVHPEDRELVNNAWTAAMSGSKYEVEHRIVVDGDIKWVRENARLEIDAKGELQAGVGTVQVITERKLYEEKLETMANYDPLTGLANRSFLLAHLKKSIERAFREKSTIALFMFDLDRFKDINDSFGHSAGDELLQLVAKRFLQRLREGDLIARLGGDEFAVVLEHMNRVEDAGRIAEEMITTLAAPYKLQGGAEIHVGASAGIVIYPQHGDEAEKLLQHADAALYKAKSEGRGNYHYYTDDLTDAARKRLKCENNLRRAIENHEFEVYYQPQVHIETGRIVGAEALVRWNDPDRGRISPAEFIPIAEETGLIREIGEWVLNEACTRGKAWLDKGYRLTVAVNLSANQVRHQNIPKMVENALKRSGFPADRLELELTESALMQREEETVAMLHTLRAMGIHLAIDDFGTGYSSLSYLKRFPIDVLKIDKSFVDDIPYEQDDMAIVSAIIAMGNALGFQILAEGTEREEQIAFLKQKGCTMYQGYFKSPPVPAEEFEKLLQ